MAWSHSERRIRHSSTEAPQNTTVGADEGWFVYPPWGFNSKAVITGDITQIDLPNANRSGLVEAIDILGKVEGIHFCGSMKATCAASSGQRIIRAYDDYKVATSSFRFRSKPGTAIGYAAPRSATGRALTAALNAKLRCRFAARCPTATDPAVVRQIAFPVRLGTILVGGQLRPPVCLETKVIILEHEDEDILATGAGPFRREKRGEHVPNWRGDVNIRITSSREMRELNRRSASRQADPTFYRFVQLAEVGGRHRISAEIAASNAPPARPPPPATELKILILPRTVAPGGLPITETDRRRDAGAPRPSSDSN